MTVVVSILFLIMGDILGVISGLDLVKEHSKYRQLGQPRIVNGEEADIRNYPFTTLILYRGEHHCGGSLYNPVMIISAAHCFFEWDIHMRAVPLIELFLAAVVGTTDKRPENYLPDHERRGITYYHVHEKYTPTSMDYDVAVARLSHPVEPSPWIGFVKVLQTGELLEIGTECVALGWGSIYAVEPLIKKRNTLNMTNPPITNRNLERSEKQYLLQMVYLRLISQEDCYQRLRAFDPVLTKRNLCTFQEEKDACQGDSGGPLYCEEKLAAVVSYGYGCAWKQLPGVFYGVNDTKWLTRAEQIIWSSSSAVIFFQNIVFLSLFTLCLWIVR